MPASLPVDSVLDALVAALRERGAAVLRAPTGAGKTTRVPPALVRAGLGPVVMLEPRRLAARAAARRMAQETGTEVGERVGYHVRFDRRVGPRTEIAVVTEGILLRRLQADPFLEGVRCVAFDEFHERSIDADLALALVQRVRREVRADLAVVVMSATLDPEPIAAFLGGAPAIECAGRAFPIDVEHLPARPREPLEESVARGLERALERTRGDVLVFLPGVGEIRRVRERLRVDAELVELYGDLPAERQDAALGPGRSTHGGTRRRIVLATNVAETSVTVEGVEAVVDSGLVRRVRYDPRVGLDRLALERVSRASAAQRAGRAGRTGPGLCVRLWSELDERSLAELEEPEVRRVDLAGPVLQLLAFGEPDPARFPWFEAPRAESLDGALALLARLGALDRGVAADRATLTPLGRELARLPLHPRLARLVHEGASLGATARAALAAALISERDPFARTRPDSPPDATDSDVLARVLALEDSARTGAAPRAGWNASAARFVVRAARDIERAAREIGLGPAAPVAADEALLRALFAAFPDRLARRRRAGEPGAVMAGGKGVRLARESGVTEAELFVCVDVDDRAGEALVRLASAVEREWLDPARMRAELETSFDAERRRVVARKRLVYEGLVLDESEAPATELAEVARVLAAAARADLARALGLERPEVAAFLARVRSLREWRPDLGLPAFGEDELAALLPRLVPGCRSFDDLARAPLLDVLRATLGHERLRAVEELAPERLAVPSGSRIRLTYEAGRPPVLAARIQELFGLRATPRVAGGRVPVLVHLLAPSGRPQQVTADLESFWRSTYPLVRKELRARYPKHAWPEDPWTAQAERRPGRRKR